MSTIFSHMASVYVQTQPGKNPVYLGDCVDLDGIPNPHWGGVDLEFCWNRRRDGYKVLGKMRSAPGPIEYTLTEILQTNVSYVRSLKCPFYLYALFNCQGAGIFGDWDLAAIVADNDIKSDDIKDPYKHGEDGLVTVDMPLSGVPPRYDPFPLMGSRMSTSETRALNALANCDNLFCGDKCGAYTIPCDNWFAAGDGAVADEANILRSTDRGVTWAATATQPFAVNENVASMVCVKIGKSTNRIIAARASTVAKGFVVKYSDDGGVTWSAEVAVSATVAEGATGPKSMVALDWQHIWVCTTTGDIYSSSDGGETWTDQNAAGASGGNPLNAISFVDEKIGYAVGDSDTIVGTTNGRLWNAKTATGTGDDLLAVTTFSQYRVLVGTDNANLLGSLWMSFDATATWEEKTFIGHATEQVVDMDFWNECIGMIITDLPSSVSDKSSFHHTIDGGHNWGEIPDIPDNSGMNAVIFCDQNEAIAVGEVESATAVILSFGPSQL